GIFGTGVDTVPAQIPYIHADRDLIDAWAPRFTSRRLRVGLVWAGSPTNQKEARRSIPLAELAPLASVPDVQFYSLQKGPAASNAPLAPLALTDLGPAVQDFADTAAALMHLDLVITIDTSMAHLAGALGRPVWVLLPYAPDW